MSSVLADSSLASWSRPWSEEANQSGSSRPAPARSRARRFWDALYAFLFEFNRY